MDHCIKFWCMFILYEHINVIYLLFVLKSTISSIESKSMGDGSGG